MKGQRAPCPKKLDTHYENSSMPDTPLGSTLPAFVSPTIPVPEPYTYRDPHRPRMPGSPGPAPAAWAANRRHDSRAGGGGPTGGGLRPVHRRQSHSGEPVHRIRRGPWLAVAQPGGSGPARRVGRWKVRADHHAFPGLFDHRAQAGAGGRGPVRRIHQVQLPRDRRKRPGGVDRQRGLG